MNVCAFVGRIATDPEHRQTASGVSCCSFKLAVQRKYKDANGEKQADFIPCVAWRSTCDYIMMYANKGDKIAVTGSLQVRKYQAQDGSNRYASEIIVDSVTICASKRNAGDEAAQMPDQMTEVEDPELPFLMEDKKA